MPGGTKQRNVFYLTFPYVACVKTVVFIFAISLARKTSKLRVGGLVKEEQIKLCKVCVCLYQLSCINHNRQCKTLQTLAICVLYSARSAIFFNVLEYVFQKGNNNTSSGSNAQHQLLRWLKIDKTRNIIYHNTLTR